jgi:hypothetical protein
MFVDDNVRRCVVFLGTKENGVFQPKATAFYVSIHFDILLRPNTLSPAY